MDQFFVKMFVTLQTGLYGVHQQRKADENGATAVEYGLMVALIAGVIVIAVTALGVRVNAIFEEVTAAIGG